MVTFSPILTFEHNIAFSIRALYQSHQPRAQLCSTEKAEKVNYAVGGWTHFSSTVTKSHKTQPVILAPFAILQCLPTTHFLILALSPTFVPSPSRLSGDICADGETRGAAPNVGDCSMAVPTLGDAGVEGVAIGVMLRKSRRLSSQYPASELARIKYTGSTTGSIVLSFRPLVTGAGSAGTSGAAMTTRHFQFG